MTGSWHATGLLKPLWGKVGGRDKLGEITGIQPPTLSGYNTGRLKLGTRNATKIAEALDVSVLELGAPATAADEQGQSILDHLAELAAEVERLSSGLAGALARLDSIESGRAKPRNAPKPRSKRASQ